MPLCPVVCGANHVGRRTKCALQAWTHPLASEISHQTLAHVRPPSPRDSPTRRPHAALTLTDEIDRALTEGGTPIVADVLGVVCDFCAIAMNKIFGSRPEVAAVYVDLDTKALSLVLSPGSRLSDAEIAELAVQAGYRIAGIRRDEAALGITL